MYCGIKSSYRGKAVEERQSCKVYLWQRGREHFRGFDHFSLYWERSARGIQCTKSTVN